MDPNANLQEQERILSSSDLRPRMRELREALHGWCRGGGYAPQWDKCPRAARAYWRWLKRV